VILGASRGLGLELQRLYLQNGWTVIGIASSYSEAVTSGDQLIRCDLRSLESSRECARRVGKLGSIHRFYWVAGKMLRGTFASNSPDDLIETMDVNFRNPILIVHAAWCRMLACGEEAKLVVVSSTASRKPKGGESVYCSTKAAQASFAKSIAQENLGSKVSVGHVIPGGMKTALWHGIEEPNFNSFNDPAKVARIVFDNVERAKTKFFEIEIPRGTA